MAATRTCSGKAPIKRRRRQSIEANMSPISLLAPLAENETNLDPLSTALSKLWPGLDVARVSARSVEEIHRVLASQDDIVLLDVTMARRGSAEEGSTLADPAPKGSQAPLLVIVTARDALTLRLIKQSASDCMLKTAAPEHLTSVQRLGQRQPMRGAGGSAASQPLPDRPRSGCDAICRGDAGPIRIIRAAVGNVTRLIQVSEVICFESADKYVNVVTETGEALVRMPLRELISKIDASDFIQVRRGVVVNMRFVQTAVRDCSGQYSLTMRGLGRTLRVSRAFSHSFRAM